MNVINLLQGSAEWHAHRATHLNASDAPAMMGESPYKTRNELLHEKATGITKEVDAATQMRFDDGHKFEALARPIAERIMGEELYPVTGENGKYSASFDGLNLGETIAFEHKSLNDDLREIMQGEYTGKDLPIYHRIQMEQQLMVSDGEKVLFMASKWSGDHDGDILVEERHCWYYPDLELRQQILDGWAQLEKDIAAYVPETPVEKVAAAEVEAFPVPSIQVKGELVACNLAEITPKFDKYLAETKTQLVTDQDFADGEANAKASREAAKNLKLTAKAVVDQIMPISEAVRTLEQYAVKFDALGLTLEKAVKEQKDAIKTTAILKAKNDWNSHIAELEIETKPIRLNLVQPDFAQTIKNVKTIKSLHSNIADALAKGKSEAESAARDIRAKLTWCKENAEGYGFLFTDLAQIITKPADDFQLVVKTRIDEHKRLEAEREAKIKADAEEAARKKIADEEAAKASQPAPILDPSAPAIASIPEGDGITKEDHNHRLTPKEAAAKIAAAKIPNFKPAEFSPTAKEIVQAVAKAFGVDEALAAKWITEADFSELKLVA